MLFDDSDEDRPNHTPTRGQLQKARLLKIDVPEGATRRELWELIEHEIMRRRQSRVGGEELPDEIARQVTDDGITTSTHARLSKASRVIQESGIKAGCVVRMADPRYFQGEPSLYTVVRVNAARMGLCTSDLSFAVDVAAAPDGHPCATLVHSPREGFAASASFLPRESGFSVRLIQEFVAMIKPRLTADEVVINDYGEFWNSKAVEQALAQIKAEKTAALAQRPNYSRYCVRCGADGVVGKAEASAERHRCTECLGKPLPRKGRHCVRCNCIFNATATRTTLCVGCNRGR